MKVANAPCSWGVLEFNLQGMTDAYQRVLDEMQMTGYVGTELGDWGFMPTNSSQLKEQLQKRDLSLVGAFVPVNFSSADSHHDGLATTLKNANLLKETNGSDAVIVLSDLNGNNQIRTKNAGRIRPEYSLDNEGWKIFTTGVDRIAREVFDQTGLSVVFHHHCGGFVETPAEIRRFLDMTNPDIINLCFDTGHYAFGGGDPANDFRSLSDRIRHVHFKDCDKVIAQNAVIHEWDYFQCVKQGIFCELGKGSIDFKRIIDELKGYDYNSWIVVEQDILPGMGSPKESAQRNREFLRTLGI